MDRAALLLGAALLLLPGPRAAAQEAKSETPDPGEKHLERFAERTGLPLETLARLREDGLGWGEIGHAAAISEKAKVPLESVLAKRAEGLGWGELAQAYGFKLGEAAGRAKRIEMDGRRADRLEPPELRRTKAQELADRFGVELGRVERLRGDGLGWGEIRHALTIHRKAALPLEEVLERREAGLGWGEIGREAGLDRGGFARQGAERPTRPAKPPKPAAGGRGGGRSRR